MVETTASAFLTRSSELEADLQRTSNQGVKPKSLCPAFSSAFSNSHGKAVRLSIEEASFD